MKAKLVQEQDSEVDWELVRGFEKGLEDLRNGNFEIYTPGCLLK